MESSTEKAPVTKLPYKTHREYFEDSYKVIYLIQSQYDQFNSTGKLLYLSEPDKDNLFTLILDNTIFHP